MLARGKRTHLYRAPCSEHATGAMTPLFSITFKRRAASHRANRTTGSGPVRTRMACVMRVTPESNALSALCAECMPARCYGAPLRLRLGFRSVCAAGTCARRRCRRTQHAYRVRTHHLQSRRLSQRARRDPTSPKQCLLLAILGHAAEALPSPSALLWKATEPLSGRRSIHYAIVS